METLNKKNCEFEDKVIDYCEGALQDKDAEAVRAHMENCAQCAELYRGHKEFCKALEACNSDVPAELHGSIMRAVRREALRAKLMKAVKRYAAPIAAALVLAITVPAVIRNGQENGATDAPLQYSVTEDAAMDVASAGDGKGRAGSQTGKNEEDVSPCAPADSVADIAEAPAAEDAGGYKVYQYVVENGEVVTCYNCPVVAVDADLFKKLGNEFTQITAENGGMLFEVEEKLLAALKKAGCDISDAKKADYVYVVEE